jgi:hypothetical protein
MIMQQRFSLQLLRLPLLVALAVGCQCNSHASPEADARRVSVVDHGAVPDDGKDDGPAIRAALEAARKIEDPVVFFPAGTYHVGEPADPEARALIEVNDFPKITIQGEESEVIGTGVKALFRFDSCGSVLARDLTVDWDPLPVVAGRVVDSSDDFIDLQVDECYPLREIPVQRFMVVDSKSRQPLRTGHKDYFSLSQLLSKKDALVVKPGVLRIFREDKADPAGAFGKKAERRVPPTGSLVLAYYNVRGGGAFPAHSCRDVHYKNLRVYAVPGMGFAARLCDRVKFEGCRVEIRPGSGRWLSSTVDASHFNMVREKVELIGCVFEDMGDDGANVHGMYAMVHEKPDARSVVLRGWGNPFWRPGTEEDLAAPAGEFRVGDELEFSSPEHRHLVAFTGRITAVDDAEIEGFTLQRVSFSEDLPDFVAPGIIVANADEVGEFVMRDCTVRRNLGQGVRIKTREALVENCLFEDNHGNGVWIFCDADYGRESISAKNVTIRGNKFRGAASAVRSTVGRKPPMDPDVFENVVIADNVIENCGPTPLNLQSIKGGAIRGNTIKDSSDDPFLLKGCSGLVIEDNRIFPKP